MLVAFLLMAVSISALPDEAQRPQELVPMGDIELVGQLGGTTEAVAIQGDYVYIGVGPRFVTMNIADRTQPAMLAQTDVLADLVRDVAVAGNYAYLSLVGAGLGVFDITDPASPQQVASLDISWPGGSAVVGNYVYIAGRPEPSNGLLKSSSFSTHSDASVDAGPELHIVDISDPTNPAILGSRALLGWSGIEPLLVDNYLFVSQGDAGIRIFDISDPGDPKEVLTFQTPGWSGHMDIKGVFVYVAMNSDGLAILRMID